MPRLNREVVVTEKIDGTNAQVYIEQTTATFAALYAASILAVKPDAANPQSVMAMMAGSRSRWLTRQTDNFGFAKFVQENADSLFDLGPGRHFGEWWGSGIQRGYDLPKGEKRFSLFNVGRWYDPRDVHHEWIDPGSMPAPSCCHVVPILGRFPFMAGGCIEECVTVLRNLGSAAAKGYYKPEGIVVFHTAANSCFKVTLEKDEKPKSA